MIEDAVLDEHAAGRKVRSGHEVDQLFGRRAGILDQIERGVAQLLGIMRRDRRGHADSDARGAVRQQVREVGGKDDRLFFLAVIRLAEIDRVLVEAIQQRGGNGRELGLGVSHRGGIIAVDIAEIALSVDERIALREALRQAHQGVVDRLVAMRVVFTDNVADDARAFLEAALGIELQLPHRVQKAPVNRLQPVAHIGERPMHDGGQRIGEITLFKRIAQIDRLDRRRFENQIIGHARTLICAARTSIGQIATVPCVFFVISVQPC